MIRRKAFSVFLLYPAYKSYISYRFWHIKEYTCVKQRYRVRKNEHFQEIRRRGQSYSNEFLVMCALPNQLSYSRFGFSVSNRLGGAVERNLIKRRLREAIRLRMDEIVSGWDIVFIAKHSIRNASYQQMDAACARLLGRAHLLRDASH